MSVVITPPSEETIRTVLGYLSWKALHFRKLLDVDSVITLDDYYRHILDIEHVRSMVYDDLYHFYGKES